MTVQDKVDGLIEDLIYLYEASEMYSDADFKARTDALNAQINELSKREAYEQVA